MTRFYTFLFLVLAIGLGAQERFLDPQFGVELQQDVVYGNNISIITGAPASQDLLMDVYLPEGDDNVTRPVMLVAHTGSFLPPLFNGQITGARSDSTVTFLCTELARRGYVAVAYTYRAGWLPTSPDQNVRTGTLLQAAYRGIQDTRTCIRNMRRTVSEENNPYGIDPDNIGVVGIGTGGYLALGAGSFFEYEEIVIDKFIDTETLLPFIDTLILGNPFADAPAAICTPNHVGYNSDFNFAFNLGGALGDREWLDGEDREPVFSGVHATNDVFAPFTDGPVIVPTTNEFVVNVAGTWAAISQANANGNNDELTDLLYDPLSELIDAQKERTFVSPFSAGMPIPLGADNFYAFETPFPEGSPWDWWDKATLDAVVAGTNMALGTDFNSDTLHINGLATNRDMSPEKGRTYMDTIMNLMLPRACVALNLVCTGVLSAEDIVQHEVSTFPNPASDQMTFRVGDATIRHLQILDLNGRLVSTHNNIDVNQYTVDRGDLQTGVYIANLIFDDGLQSIKIVFD